MPTIITLSKNNKQSLPKDLQSDDNRFSDELVEYFLEKYTKKNDTVLDPFAGFGTTLFSAAAMGRKAIGIEYDQKRYSYIKEHIEGQNLKDLEIIEGDALKIEEYSLPEIDFSITSPPYMNKDDPEFPLTAYTTKGNYRDYLKGIREVYRQINKALKKESYTVVEVANLKKKQNYGEEITTLAWDIGLEISEVMHFVGEIIVSWVGEDTGRGIYGYGYDHSYCLVFQQK
ncbi:MAG: methyltransferase domain-containing protein [Candidatus Heimdallarchaeota archaeon]|nr:methyltransferase domain-containing protein [Candidatus Heimdallarchaeota archaeon]MCK5047794.1 methyltransferase domain-containing protein [Candidatus Heimdallarchaeota archaeon]